MAKYPDSTKTSLEQRLRARARERWPQIASLRIRHRGNFSYIDATLTGTTTLKLCRLRYIGSAHDWQFAIYRASHDDYDESVFFTGLPVGTCQDALDTACGLYLNDPTAWTPHPTNLRPGPLRCGALRGRRWHRRGPDVTSTAGMTAPAGRVHLRVKKIGFLSFGHWSEAPGSQVRSASDSLLQSIELAVAAEEVGADGAYFRVHHFARQLGSPFPLLAAVGARTSRIEIGTAVIDMRYENPLYMAEDAGAADLIATGRLQLGISRGSPEQVIDGWRYFGYVPQEGQNDADMARQHAEVFLEVLKGEGFAQPSPRPMFHNPPGLLRVEPHSEGLRDRIWWGAASNGTAVWAAKLGMNLQSSTLKENESDKPFHVQQAEQIQEYREAWKEAGHEREPRVSVSRSIFALVDRQDWTYFGARNQDEDHVGYIEAGMQAIFGRTYAAEPDKLIDQLKEDEAIAAADTLLLTVPNQLGVEYNAHVIESILTHVAPALGWR